MNTEMTLFKRGIRKLDSLRPPQRDTLDAFEVFGRIADTCYFDEYGILCFENKEDRVNEEFLRLAFGEEIDVHIPNEEGEEDAHIPNEEGEQNDNLSVGSAGEYKSPFMEQFDNSRSFSVSLL